MTSSPGQAAALALYERQRRPLFTLGTLLITPGALDMLEALQGTSKNRRFQPATVSSGLKSSGLPVL